MRCPMCLGENCCGLDCPKNPAYTTWLEPMPRGQKIRFSVRLFDGTLVTGADPAEIDLREAREIIIEEVMTAEEFKERFR